MGARSRLTGHVDKNNGNTQTKQVLVIGMRTVSMLTVLNILTQGKLVMTSSVVVGGEDTCEKGV